jgi:hypothetical protein
MSLETVGGKAEQLGFYETVMGDAAQLFVRLAQFRAVTADDVQRAARRVFERSQRTRIEVLPEVKSGGKAPRRSRALAARESSPLRVLTHAQSAPPFGAFAPGSLRSRSRS